MKARGPQYAKTAVYADVCQHCYLSTCFYQSHYLGFYCPETAARKRKIDPKVVAEISRGVGTNRRHEFIRRMNCVTKDDMIKSAQ